MHTTPTPPLLSGIYLTVKKNLNSKLKKKNT